MGHFQSAHRSSIKFSPSASHQYMQSIWRKIQSLGLEDVYRSNDPTLKPFVQEMTAIAFCPPSFVCPVWLGVQQEAPQVPQVDSLVEYFDSAWIIGQFQLELFRFGWPTCQQPCWRLAFTFKESGGKTSPYHLRADWSYQEGRVNNEDEGARVWVWSKKASMEKEDIERGREGFRFCFRDSLVEQLTLMNTWSLLRVYWYCETLIQKLRLTQPKTTNNRCILSVHKTRVQNIREGEVTHMLRRTNQWAKCDQE